MALENTQRLSVVGPRDPGHGFPRWFEDDNATRLELGVGPDTFTPAGEQLPSPGAPLSFPDNFPEEAFYFYAESEMPVGGVGVVGRARLILALEAAFGGVGTPAEGARVVFARIRVRMDDVVPGAEYVVTHPYGVTDPMPADDRGRVFVTDDRGIADEDFERVLEAGLVAPFLVATTVPDAGHLGDGVTPHTLTGSPFGTDFFRIDGPRVGDGGGPVDPADPTNRDRVHTELFTVQGRRATQLGAEITRASYGRNAAGVVDLDVFARSAPGQTLELGQPRIAATAADRDYVMHTRVPDVPATVEVVNVTDNPSTRTAAPVTDLVLVRSASYNPSTRILKVNAASSDSDAPTLTVEGHGALTATPTVFADVDAVPEQVVVTSAAGGRGTRPVNVTGPASPTLPVLADAGADLEVVTGREGRLDATASRGPVTGWSWSQLSGTTVTLSDASVPIPTFTAPAPGTIEFRVTVTGDGGPSSDTVSVTVLPVPPPDTIDIDRAEFRTSKQQWRVGGTLTGSLPAEVVVDFVGQELGRSPVDATGGWDVRRTLTSADASLLPTVGDSVTATSAAGGTDTAAINIRN